MGRSSPKRRRWELEAEVVVAFGGLDDGRERQRKRESLKMRSLQWREAVATTRLVDGREREPKEATPAVAGGRGAAGGDGGRRRGQ